MKSLFILISLAIISFVLNDDDCEGLASKYSECEKLKVNPSTNHCCFVKYEYNGQDVKGCMEITKEQYEKIDDLVKENEKESGVKNFDIDCSSAYLSISLLSLILILI